MADSFVGWAGVDWIFTDWENTTVTIRTRPTTGHTWTDAATGVECKSDGERRGLGMTEAGMMDLQERKFFFAITYAKAAETNRDIRNYLNVGDVLVENGHEWTVISVSEPGDADEHIEVDTRLGVPGA